MRRFWTAEELQTVRQMFPHVRTARLAEILGRKAEAVSSIAQKLGLHKSEQYLASPDTCRLRRGDQIGKAYQFKPGEKPWNTGVKMPGYAPGRMAETQFKPGRRPRLPIGAHRVDTEGFLLRRTSDTGYGGTDWKLEHRLLWEEAFGPIPKGHKLCFKDGDRKNVKLDNLVLLTDAEVMARNTIHNLPEDLVEVIRLNGKIKQVLRRRYAEKQDDRSAQPSL